MSKEPKEQKNKGSETPQKPKGHTLLGTLVRIAIGAGAVYGYNEWSEDNKEPTEKVPPVVQKVEAPMACPQFNPTSINGTATEWRAQADVASRLGSTSFRFSSELNKVIASEAYSFMVEAGNTQKAECLFYTCDKLLKSFKYDAEHPHIDQDADQTRLFSCFPVTMAVLTQDLYGSASLRKKQAPRGRIVHATVLRTKALAANLNGYSKEESAELLDTFGGMMVEPNLAKKAAEAGLENPERTANMVARVHSTTADIMEDNPTLSAHQAACRAVRVAFEDDVCEDPLAFNTAVFSLFYQGDRKPLCTKKILH